MPLPFHLTRLAPHAVRGLTLACAMLLAVLSPAHADTPCRGPGASPLIKVGYIPVRPPYQDVNDFGVPIGLDIDITRALFTAMRCDVEYVSVGWPRALLMLEKGIVDVLAGASYSPERAEYAHFSKPYRHETVALFVREGQVSQFPLTSLADVETQTFRLGVTGKALYGPDFAALMERPGFRAMVTEMQGQELPALVSLGRLDGYLLDVEIAAVYNRDRLATQPAPGALDRHPAITIDNGPVHLMLSRATITDDFMDRLNRAIEQHQALPPS